jgi:hypothetical protein
MFISNLNSDFVNNISSEIIYTKCALEPSIIKTYTEHYVNMIFEQYKRDEKNTWVEFSFIDLNSLPSIDTFSNINMSRILKKYDMPISTTLLFLDDSKDIFVTTNIDNEKFKYKLFDEEKELYVLLPVKGTQITFYGYFGKIAINPSTDKCTILMIRLYDSKIENSINHSSIFRMTNTVNYSLQLDTTEIEPAEIVEDIFTHSFFENFFYKKEVSKPMIDKLKQISNNEKYVKVLKNHKISDVSEKDENIRFMQRFLYKNIYSKMVCKWILYEYKKMNENASCDIDKIPAIFSFVISSLEEVLDILVKSYSIKKDKNITITSMKIQKTPISNLLTCVIGLNPAKLKFNDGIIYELDQGDLILYNESPMHIESDECIVLGIDL